MLLDWGLFCQVDRLGSEPAPETLSGTVHLIDGTQRPVRQTQLIPGLLGRGFGTVVSLPPGRRLPLPVMVEVLHPPMGPDGITRQAWPSILGSSGPTVSTWSFDLPAEVVPGDWRFRMLAGREVLLEIPFRVSLPDPAAPPGPCDPEAAISSTTPIPSTPRGSG